MSKKKTKKQANGRPLPPVETRFKPGQSGNPKGAKPGWKSMKVRIRELLAAMPPEEVIKAAKKIGLTKSVDAKDVMILAQIQRAWRGDTKAARFLAEYSDGKPEQPISGGETPLEILYIDSRFKKDGEQ